MKKSLIAGFALAGSLFAASHAFANESAQKQDLGDFGLESTDVVDLGELRCWDMVTLSEDDRAFAMVLLYGFARGQASESKMSARDVQTAVVNTMLECVDKPNEKALDVLKTHIVK
ncbi:HdeA/HdeB family chaperone [uncultured Erythrobacter sp.]|uniref:HdeA/HdeB family chaperone n=1 Tax=uncultured Erythrobacter sp. TaxID=263913 RepID=UPI002635170D|nr:HdeA/HdeB family chaperone [uncultured Erythrobacter sp.]